jgi:hypothetical protein|nr:MAG TPA: hypothetical protein [Caudoviricetes sp.]
MTWSEVREFITLFCGIGAIVLSIATILLRSTR